MFRLKSFLLLLALLLPLILGSNTNLWANDKDAHKHVISNNITTQNKTTNGDYVVLLHGIARSSKHMQKLAAYLSQHGYKVINLDYPSTEHTLEDLVEIINKDLNLKIHDIGNENWKNKQVHFVGYSMGGLLVRALLHKHRPNNLGRVIQLASPNHGSEVADFLENNWLYKKIYGAAGAQLTTKQDAKLQMLLGEVNYELGVIAGNRSIDPISSLIIPGNDDGKVSIASTKVKGMKDHIIVGGSHTFFPGKSIVHKQTLYFLEHGYFNKSVNQDREKNL